MATDSPKRGSSLTLPGVPEEVDLHEAEEDVVALQAVNRDPIEEGVADDETMLVDGDVLSPKGARRLGVPDDLVRDPAVPDPTVDGDHVVSRGDQVRVGDVDVEPVGTVPP